MSIFNNNQVFATVWDAKLSESGKSLELRIGTSEKDQDGSFVNSTWWPRAIGHAFNTLKDVKRGDRITITKHKISNESKKLEDGSYRTYFKMIILEANISGQENNSEPETAAPATAPTIDKKKEDVPW